MISNSMVAILILFAMLYMHIKSDFNQGIIASMKQSKWWKDNYNNELYKNDYRIVLVIHSVEWSISILFFPVAHYILTGGDSIVVVIAAFIANVIIHTRVDDSKANRLTINLITDQVIHFIQISITWFILVVIL